MKSFSKDPDYALSHLVNLYPWSQFITPQNPSPLVVDLGGSLGHASAAIAAAHPSLRFVVQDLARLYASGDPAAKISEDVRDRVSFMVQDFFEEQAIKGADVYLIRWCLHNWSDKYVIKILRALIPALKTGARIVINDGVLPEPRPPTGSWDGPAGMGDLSSNRWSLEVDADYQADKSFRSLDLLMLQALNARERDLDEWKELFREADERFVWKQATASGKMWIMEAEWSG